MSTPVRTPENKEIAGIDFAMLKKRLLDEEEGIGWSPAFLDRVEVEYRRFLTLMKLCPDRAIVPSKTVDAFWHAHILDTQAYTEDCDIVFGHFVHHFPYFGMRGEKDAENLVLAYADTLELYSVWFRELPPEDIWLSGAAAQCPNCGRRCRG